MRLHKAGPFQLRRFWAFFYGTGTACVKRILAQLPKMSALPDNTAPADAAEPPKKKRRETVSKPRAPARPYRRLDGAVLESRLKELNKKLAVMRSKVVLLEDRLEGHDNEATLREAETA